MVIGISTGGPSALARLIPALPGELAVPVLVVQHMPAQFTASLADSLDRKSELSVREAPARAVPCAGEVLIARGGRHLVVKGGPEPYLDLDDSEPVNSFRPSVDVLFESAARAFAGRVLGVVMTGMGSDGLAGATALREQGATASRRTRPAPRCTGCRAPWSRPARPTRSSRSARWPRGSRRSLRRDDDSHAVDGRVRRPAPADRGLVRDRRRRFEDVPDRDPAPTPARRDRVRELRRNSTRRPATRATTCAARSSTASPRTRRPGSATSRSTGRCAAA